MAAIKIKRALVSVSDKTGVAEFVKTLADEFGVQIISTGGTARALRDAGIQVTDVAEVTGFAEMMDGRVKTLHPKIHAGLLADRDNPDHMAQLAERGIEPIDMVLVNLYPFERTVAKPGCTFADAIENIDIGGPCMIRASAKNHRGVVIVPSATMYEPVLEAMRAGKGLVPDDLRTRLARMAFAMTCRYDQAIASYLAEQVDAPDPLADVPAGSDMLLGLADCRPLTYGENPHQKAIVARTGRGRDEATLLGAVRAGNMSFNNYNDGDAALGLIKELTRAQRAGSLGGACAAAVIKHTNPAGVAIGDDPVDVYRRAYLGDPVAAAGGITAVNFRVTRPIAEAILGSYANWGKAAGAGFFTIDVFICPEIDDDALALMTTPTDTRSWPGRLRLLAVGDLAAAPDPADVDVKRIAGGLLVQSPDLEGLNDAQWKTVTQRGPTDAEGSDLRLAWLICKHTKSNAVTLVKDNQLLGNGAGQMSRVKAAEVAIELARELGHADQLAGAAAATDAFYPVPDGPTRLLDAGVKALIHPGGSKRDQDTIDLCNQRGAAMVLTGTRHFRH